MNNAKNTVTIPIDRLDAFNWYALISLVPDRNDREQYIKDIMNNPLQYDTEYTYLAEKYSFKYWLETWQEERLENEDNSYHGMSE